MEKIVVDNKNIIKVIKLTDNDLNKELKHFNIQYTTIFIEGYMYYKFYCDGGVVIVPEEASVFVNTSTKKFIVGYDYSLIESDI